MGKILVADDEENIRLTFSSFLNDAGHCVQTADSLSSCRKKMQLESFDLLFLDIGFGLDNGIDAISELKGLQPDCAVMIITGCPTPETIIKARRQGAADYLVKPVHQPSLLYNTQKILTQKNDRKPEN